MSCEGFKEQDPTFATRAIHVAQEPEQWTSMAVVPPISLATTFKQDGPADFRVSCRQSSLSQRLFIAFHCVFVSQMFEYGRSGNPTRNVLEKVLASLEGAKHG